MRVNGILGNNWYNFYKGYKLMNRIKRPKYYNEII